MSPPPTEKAKIASLELILETLSHSEILLSQPSSLIRAVNSETLSKGE